MQPTAPAAGIPASRPIPSGYAELSTAEVSDALDRLGLPGSALGIASVSAAQRLLGRAYTVRYAPADVQPGTVGDYIDDVPAGAVVVLDNGGRTDCTVWGGILTEVASRRGIAGTVINGVCRDADAAAQFSYPLFSRGRFMRTGKDRVQVDEVNGDVSLGDVRVRPGDILLGDGDGVVVVPQAREDEVLALALRTRDAEQAIVDSVRAGMSLTQARQAHGYHTLQRRGR
ncbi:RraA family protein [Bordetella genomosp. 9]|uniref:Putative 4-hydroxy-4-methyl-2-oxoglutarate aldolase n=1 Tax=Bordetella genomosp. 9 TaxID=1416803 RepID=A0A1W6YW64_9BORD|nr:RraA family protein [Bordetella genomosp. 9]ARP85352.1 diguanylate cyclase [Bordetella genomosp. 9]